jgi:iron(III) transport system substrate-binding protein
LPYNLIAVEERVFMRTRTLPRGAAGALALLAVAALAAAAGASAARQAPPTLTVYSGQHEELVDSLAKAFTAKTGIELSIRSGEDADLVNQIDAEGSKSPADVFLSEEPGPVGALARQGKLAAVPKATLAKVDRRLVPSTRNWVPYAARSRVIFYDPKLISAKQLPHSILDLSKPRWKGMFAYAPSGAFVGTVSYLINAIGAHRTLAWLKGIEANGVNEGSNGTVRDTVEAGQHPFGLANHYYWWRLAQTKGGPSHLTSRIYYFDHPDAGGLVLASGAAVLKTSRHKAEARRFLAWLVSRAGQSIVGGADANDDGAQFPVIPGMKSRIKGIPALSSLHPPKVNQSVFSDTKQATKLIERAGIS